jgi:hypothetical protein
LIEPSQIGRPDRHAAVAYHRCDARNVAKSRGFSGAVQNVVEKLFGLWGQAPIFCTEIFLTRSIRDCRPK